jgi:mannose/fructose/N-acetylgalactosamine-specific phosphotransferase system component IID
MENRFSNKRNMQGDARRCAVKSPMWNDEPTRSIGFGISLWPTVSMFYTRVEDYSTKLRRNHTILREFCA